MTDIPIERTLATIAAEINIIKQQTAQLMLNNFIEIGLRLSQAKDLVPYGQ